MPLDASIPLSVQPPKLMGPADMISLQGLVRQNQLGQMQLEDVMASRSEKEALRAALAGPGSIDPQTGTVSLQGLQAAYGASPEAGMRLAKDRQASLKSIAELGKIDAETLKLKLESAGKQADIGKKAYEAAAIAYDAAKAKGIPEAQAVAAGQAALLSQIDEMDRSGLTKLAGLTPEIIAKARSEAPDPALWKSKAQSYTQFLTDLRAQQGMDITKAGQAETQRHNKATEGQAGAALAETQRHNRTTEANAAATSGVPAGYRRTADGNLEPIPGGPATKQGEAQVKQGVGVDNTRAAITEYRNALKAWGGTDILNPAARARMGTVYNNMLLQAKEAYNLGVLNGPDYKILQEVITSPSSLKGGITSKEALDDQAKKLDEIMGRIGATVSGASKQQTPKIDLKSEVEKAGGTYEPDKYDYRVVDGKVQRKKKNG